MLTVLELKKKFLNKNLKMKSLPTPALYSSELLKSQDAHEQCDLSDKSLSL